MLIFFFFFRSSFVDKHFSLVRKQPKAWKQFWKIFQESKERYTDRLIVQEINFENGFLIKKENKTINGLLKILYYIPQNPKL